MSWTLSVVSVAALALSLAIVLRIKRLKDQSEMEQHSITAEELHALLASNQEVLLFDVRQPLDLLAYPEIIPKARRIAPNEVLERPSLIPKEKDAVVYCTSSVTPATARATDRRHRIRLRGSSVRLEPVGRLQHGRWLTDASSSGGRPRSHPRCDTEPRFVQSFRASGEAALSRS